MSASDSEKRRLERAREAIQKKAARRRVEAKAKRNKQQREAEKRRQRIQARDPEGVREQAAVAKEETKDLASAAGELVETAPGGKTLKSLAKKGAAAVGGAAAQAGPSGSGGSSLRERLAKRTSPKPVELESGYEEVNGEMLGYYQAGEDGQKFYYVPGNEASRVQAKRAAKELIPEGGGGGRRPQSVRELARQAAVDEEFLSLGTRAEYDPAPPVRENRDAIQPQSGKAGGLGAIGFNWGGSPRPVEADRARRRSDFSMDFQWGGDAEESDDEDGGGMFGGFGGVDFEW